MNWNQWAFSIRYPDTSDLRHFGPKKLGPKSLNISDLGPKCPDTSDLKVRDTSDLEFLVYFFLLQNVR